MIDSTVRLVGATQSVTLTDSIQGLMRQQGGGGWGMAPVINAWFEGAGDGARLRGTRRTTRTLDIPVKAFGSTRAEVEAVLRLMAQSIHDPFRVYVDFDDTRSYWIDAAYETGAEGLYGVDPTHFNDMALSLKCSDPYWTSSTSQSFIVAPQPSDEPFLPDWANLHVGSALALGNITVNNMGDVASKPTWIIRGPGIDPSITLDGKGFVLNKTLVDTDIITIKYEEGGWTIKDQTGANLYADLSAAPYFIEFPPGSSIVDVSMDATGPTSYVQAVYPERREVLY